MDRLSELVGLERMAGATIAEGSEFQVGEMEEELDDSIGGEGRGIGSRKGEGKGKGTGTGVVQGVMEDYRRTMVGIMSELEDD